MRFFLIASDSSIVDPIFRSANKRRFVQGQERDQCGDFHHLRHTAQRGQTFELCVRRGRIGTNVHVGDIRERGYLLGMEFVVDRDRRTPFDPALGLNPLINAATFARGLMVYPGGGTIDGTRGDHIVLAPPYTTSEAELDLIVDRLGDAVDVVFAGIGGPG